MKRAARTATVALLLLVTAVLPRAAATPSTDDVPFAEVAEAYRTAHGITGSPGDVDLAAHMDANCVRVRLGLLDVRYPKRALADKEQGEQFKLLCREVLRVQGHWLDWIEPLGGDLKLARKQLKEVDSWVKSWNVAKLRKLEGEAEADLLVILKAKAKQAEAVQAFGEQMGRGVGLGIARTEPVYSDLLLCPTRREFVEFICFAGWLFPVDQGLFWVEDLDVWLECRVRDLRVLALEFAHPEHRDDWTVGLQMNGREKTGLQQHVTQRAMYSLMFNYFGKDVDQGITSGLAINMVIDLFGEDNTRSEGDLKGGSTAPFEVFVPGGNPGGGSLPPVNADSRFRENKGDDYFLRPLRHAQKQGAEDGRSPRDKLVKFLLIADDDVERYSIEGPYLGTAAKEIVPPPERFKSDYLEFFRAYKSAFVYWLRSSAGDSSKDSALRFAQLLKGLTDRPEGERFESLFPEIYPGLALSEKDLDETTLEGLFLRWLRQG